MAISKPQKGAGIVAAATAIAVALAGPITRGFEGDVRHPNKDPVGREEVCYGETSVPLREYSEEECRAMLTARQTGTFAPIVYRAAPKLADGNHADEYAAAIDFAYNVGQFGKTSMAVDFKAGREREVADDFLKYRFGRRPDGTKVPLPGLTRRRECERAMWLGDARGVSTFCPKGSHL